MKLLPSIYLVGSGSTGIYLTNYLDCNVYLVDCKTEYVLIDSGAGYDIKPLLSEINRIVRSDKPLSSILLTHHHGDHAGGAALLKELYHCRVYAPAAETASIVSADEHLMGLDVARDAGFYPPDYHFSPCQVDVMVQPGMSFSIGNTIFSVFDASGHSTAGVCYYLTKDQKHILFVGDLLCFNGLISLQNIPGANLEHYRDSVLSLESVPVDCFFPGHGCFSLSDGDKHIQKAISAFRSLAIPQNSI